MVLKHSPDDDPHQSGFLEDLAERVFKDYEPPKPDNPVEVDEDQSDEDQSAA